MSVSRDSTLAELRADAAGSRVTALESLVADIAREPCDVQRVREGGVAPIEDCAAVGVPPCVRCRARVLLGGNR